MSCIRLALKCCCDLSDLSLQNGKLRCFETADSHHWNGTESVGESETSHRYVLNHLWGTNFIVEIYDFLPVKVHLLNRNLNAASSCFLPFFPDKILARYSTDFTVYRELLQNSDDAQSTGVDIEFQRCDSKGRFGLVVYRNNGMPFRPQDWDRLRTIAEGNPDESKIGFFGVGFYSAFSICDEPMYVDHLSECS